MVAPATTRHRLGLLALGGLTLFVALFARLWFLQVVEAPAHQQGVSASTTRTVVDPAPRGEIFDRNGITLVENVETTVIAIDKQELRRLDDDERDAAIVALVGGLNRFRLPADSLSVDDIEKQLADERNSEFRPVPVARDISMTAEIYFREEAHRYPAVVVERQIVRRYPYGSLAAHTLGRVGPITQEYLDAHLDETAKPYHQNDEVGLAGVEQSYERYLRGTPGRRVFEVDSRNRIVRELAEQRIEPERGDDVYLSIDARIQYKTEEALAAWIINSKSPTPAGAATILDPRNGQVVAMASYPTYDPNTLVGGISEPRWDELNAGPDKKIMNRAMSEGYPAASTFKLATAYAGLKLGLVDPNMAFNDIGYYQIPGCQPADSRTCRPQNANRQRHGVIDLSGALTVSSDAYFYRIGADAWAGYRDSGRFEQNALQEQIEDLGYGSRTGIDLPAEAAGVVPTPESLAETADAMYEQGIIDAKQRDEGSRWSAGQSTNLAIGQGSTVVTPLQTANAYAALANADGILYEPSVVDRVTAAGDPDTVRYALERETREIRRIDWGGAREHLLDGFSGAINQPGGTAYGVFTEFPLGLFPLSGKTGTAEVGDGPNQKADNSMFVAFGPNPESRYVVSMLIEGGRYGSSAAAPAVRMILEPIADGSIEQFEIPEDGTIDAESAAASTNDYQRGGAD